MEKEQAEIAILWQKQRPAVSRDKLGRIKSKHKETLKLDSAVCYILKELKKQNNIDDVMKAQTNLIKIIHTLKQIIYMKG